MSLLEEVSAEAEQAQANAHRSKIEVFIDTLPPLDRAQFDEWHKKPTEIASMWRVLKRRGMTIAEPTFRAWVARTCP